MLFFISIGFSQSTDTVFIDTLWMRADIQKVLKLDYKQEATIRIIDLYENQIIRSHSTEKWSIRYLDNIPFDLNMGYTRDIIISGGKKKGRCLELDIYTTEFRPNDFPSVRLHIVAKFRKKKGQYIFQNLQHSQWD